MVARHKLFKNMNLNARDEDDALSDGGEEYISPEHQALLNDGLDQVRNVIGGADESGLSDADIKDVLWDCHFDIEETVQWALEEQEKIHQAQERKALLHAMKDLPPLPQSSENRELGYGEYSPPSIVPRRVIEDDSGEPEERSHVPLIVLAQQQYDPTELEPEGAAPVKRNLSTITERTERTEMSPHWPTRQHLMSLNLPRAPSSVTTSYGRAVEQAPGDTTANSLDPDLIPVSPSGSAVHRLSFYEPAPSMPPSETGTYDSYPSPKAPSEPVPPLDTIPDIPDLNSKSSRHVAAQPAKKSKLAMLATSRATTSSTRSESSRSSGMDVLGSVKTYPDLRPSSRSLRSPSSVASTAKPSSTSSHVRRAIQTALELEAGDRDPLSEAETITGGARTPTQTLDRPSAPTPSKIPEMPSSSGSPPATRQLSKLALLAQANKAARIVKPGKTGPPPLPEEHTEYLTPIANGSTVTTAITTSYQSLYSLTDPTRPPKTTAPFVVPLPAPTYVASPPDTKKSKLAMKIKKAQEKNLPTSVPPEVPPPSIPPMFLPKPTRTRASPSAFASLLVDDTLPSEVSDADVRIVKQKKLKEKQSEEQPRHRSKRHPPTAVPHFPGPNGFAFDDPSPDDIVLNALAREREKAQKLLVQKQLAEAKSVSSSRASSPVGNLARGGKKSTPVKKLVPSANVDQRQLDLSGLNLVNDDAQGVEEAPKMTFAQDKLLEEVKRAIEAQGKPGLSIVVIGHVDAGKSTLMGRLLYELGRMDERTRTANERNSTKAGKGSFSWAWGLDSTAEERERGITMDVALESFSTAERQITVLDAPGHKEFIPNMISGASQADCAVLVVDASTGEFEAGFDRGGQTREHLILARSLGVAQVIVAINKLDQVQWEKNRYDDICSLLRPFLVQSGFRPSQTKFVPVGAILGVNLARCEGDDAKPLLQWYSGPTLVDLLDQLEPPSRDITSPVRLPISNIFKAQGSGTFVSGRLLNGVIQVGERLRILPGDETAVVKFIEVEEENVPWAAAGSNLTLSLVSVDAIQLAIGSVLCPPMFPVPLASVFTARIIIFDIQVPIISGAMVELFHHSRDVPASVSKLIAALDRSSGKVVKSKPRVLMKTSSAEVQITLRATGASGSVRPIPLEPYTVNKAMGRILIRREGETIAAGVVMEILN